MFRKRIVAVLATVSLTVADTIIAAAAIEAYHLPEIDSAAGKSLILDVWQ